MKRQIGELTDLVLALTQQISSNPREGNGLNTVTTSTNSRSDMVTGVPNPQPSGSRTTPPNGTPRSDDVSAPRLTDVMTEIHHLRNSMGDTITQPKNLQTQVPLFKGVREKTTSLSIYYSIICGGMSTNKKKSRNLIISRAFS